MKETGFMSWVVAALAMMGFISPPLFGFMVFKLQSKFVPREVFDEYRETLEQQRIEAQERANRERAEILKMVEKIDSNVTSILKMKADERGRR